MSTKPRQFVRKVAIVAGAVTILIGPTAQSTAHSQTNHDEITQLNPEEMKWAPAPPTVAKDAQLVVLTGNPQAEGAFTLRLKTVAGYVAPLHRHTFDEVVTIISGEAAFGIGVLPDCAKDKTLVAGGFIKIPANTPHYIVSCTDTVFQITGDGPIDEASTIYANPAEDPRRK